MNVHRVKEENGKYVVWLDKKQSDFNKMLDSVRALPGREWDSKKFRWVVPKSSKKILSGIGFEIPKDDFENSVADDSVKISSKYKFLKPYQSYGVSWLMKRKRALLGDDMGLGKTAQIVVMLSEMKVERLPALVICPASLKINWKREFEKWANIDSCIISGSEWSMLFESVVIINYDILSKHKEKILEVKFKTVICDESHYIKNAKTKRSSAVREIVKRSENFYAVSGTPIENRPSEFFTTLNIIDSVQFGNFWRYASRYCGAKHNGYGWDFGGHSNTDELFSILDGNIMLRRKKTDVLKELPEKQRFLIPFEIDLCSSYFSVLNSDFSIAIERLQSLKREAARSKLKQAIEWISEQIDSGNKIICFAIHHDIIDSIFSHFRDISVKLDGRDNQKSRDDSVQRFQNDDSCRLFVGNIKAAGVGITLTASSNVVFAEFDWVPGVNIQAEDRAHRIGQTDSVTCWYLVADGTIEEDIFDLLNKKKMVLDSVLDGDNIEEIEKGIFWDLANKYCKK